MEINLLAVLKEVRGAIKEELKKDLPKDVADGIEEMGEVAGEIHRYMAEAKVIPEVMVQRYNDLSMRYFASRNRKLKAMISQPMNGRSEEEIAETRAKARANLEEAGYEFVNTLFTDEWYSEEQMEKRGVVNKPLCFLAKSVEHMCECDVVYFCNGWDNARGCRIEHEIAEQYGLQIVYEEDFKR